MVVADVLLKRTCQFRADGPQPCQRTPDARADLSYPVDPGTELLAAQAFALRASYTGPNAVAPLRQECGAVNRISAR